MAEFLEFPKWVTPEGGEPVIVQDADEEARVMGSGKQKRARRSDAAEAAAPQDAAAPAAE